MTTAHNRLSPSDTDALHDALSDWRRVLRFSGRVHGRLVQDGAAYHGSSDQLWDRHDAYTRPDGYDHSQPDVSPGVYTGEPPAVMKHPRWCCCTQCAPRVD